jgi:hypothetical protein
MQKAPVNCKNKGCGDPTKLFPLCVIEYWDVVSRRRQKGGVAGAAERDGAQRGCGWLAFNRPFATRGGRFFLLIFQGEIPLFVSSYDTDHDFTEPLFPQVKQATRRNRELEKYCDALFVPSV